MDDPSNTLGQKLQALLQQRAAYQRSNPRRPYPPRGSSVTPELPTASLRAGGVPALTDEQIAALLAKLQANPELLVQALGQAGLANTATRLETGGVEGLGDLPGPRPVPPDPTRKFGMENPDLAGMRTYGPPYGGRSATFGGDVRRAPDQDIPKPELERQREEWEARAQRETAAGEQLVSPGAAFDKFGNEVPIDAPARLPTRTERAQSPVRLAMEAAYEKAGLGDLHSPQVTDAVTRAIESGAVFSNATYFDVPERFENFKDNAFTNPTAAGIGYLDRATKTLLNRAVVSPEQRKQMLKYVIAGVPPKERGAAEAFWASVGREADPRKRNSMILGWLKDNANIKKPKGGTRRNPLPQEWKVPQPLAMAIIHGMPADLDPADFDKWFVGGGTYVRPSAQEVGIGEDPDRIADLGGGRRQVVGDRFQGDYAYKRTAADRATASSLRFSRAAEKATELADLARSISTENVVPEAFQYTRGQVVGSRKGLNDPRMRAFFQAAHLEANPNATAGKLKVEDELRQIKRFEKLVGALNREGASPAARAESASALADWFDAVGAKATELAAGQTQPKLVTPEAVKTSLTGPETPLPKKLGKKELAALLRKEMAAETVNPSPQKPKPAYKPSRKTGGHVAPGAPPAEAVLRRGDPFPRSGDKKAVKAWWKKHAKALDLPPSEMKGGLSALEKLLMGLKPKIRIGAKGPYKLLPMLLALLAGGGAGYAATRKTDEREVS